MPVRSPQEVDKRGTLIAGKYRLLYPIGEGSRGVVWAALNDAAGREVALKIFTPADLALRERAQRSARLLGALRHNHIVEHYDSGETNDKIPYSVMQLLQGETLDHLLNRKGSLSQPEAARIGRDVADALVLLHASQIVHGSLTSWNIFMHRDSEQKEVVTKVLDAGLGERPPLFDNLLMAKEEAAASVMYMSPEQIRGRQEVDHRADIWAVGIIMFEMLTGARPFAGAKVSEAIAKIMTGEIPRLDQSGQRIAGRLADVVACCLQPNREKRFASAGDLALALDGFTEAPARSHNVGSPGLPDVAGSPQTGRASEPASPTPAPPSVAAPALDLGQGSPKPGDVIDDRYHLIRPLGEGGMGSVWSAEDVRLKRDVAIKLLSRSLAESVDLRRRFEREAIAAARLRSPHIVTIHDYGFDSRGRPYIVQDLILGRDLRGILEAETQLERGRAARLAIQACTALDAIHSEGLIHRDIKPGNLLITKISGGHEHLMLVDFGIAKAVDGVREGVNTTTGVVLGTPHYMSPEQIHSGDDVDKRTDIYSLGATLYETLSGRKPFSGDVSTILQNKLLFVPPPLASVANVSPAMNAVIMRCLDPDRKNRFESATSLRQALVETPEVLDDLRLSIEFKAQDRAHDAPRPADVASFEATRAPVADPTPTMKLGATLVVAVDEIVRAEIRDALPFAPQSRNDASRVTIGAAGAAEAGSLPTKMRHAPALRSEEKSLQVDLVSYLEQAGLRVRSSERGLMRLERRPDARLPDVDIAAMLLEDSAGADAPQATMDTLSFQRKASPLYGLSGTQERPVTVFAVFRGHPGAGIYRQWHELLQTKHVRVLPLSPGEIRAHVRSGQSAKHVLSLLQRPSSNAFQLEGPVEREVDFFGSSRLLGELVARLAGSGQSFGVFGLKKWGTTSFLRRLRMELTDRVTAWVDVASLFTVSAAEVLSALCEDLSRELRRKAPAALTKSLASHQRQDSRAAADALRSLVWSCHETCVEGPPIFFLDGIDELSRSRTSDADDLKVLFRSLYSLMSLDPRAILVFAGTEDDLLSKQVIGGGAKRFENPFWTRVSRYCAPLFDEHELGEFFRTAGALAGLHFTTEALEAACRLTGGQKYLCRLLGSELHQRQACATEWRSLDRDDVEECVGSLIVKCSEYFHRLLLEAPPGTRELLCQLARGPARERELLGLNTGNPAMHRLRALQFSVMHGLARKELRGPYRLAIGLIGEWLQWSSPGDPKGDWTELRLKDGGGMNCTGEGGEPREPARAEGALHQHTETLMGVGPTAEEKIELRRMIVDRFQPSELELLADNLGVDIMAVTSIQRPLPNQALDLVRWASQHGQFGKLRQLVEHHRYGGLD
ncbi:protein kinase domain-containing protein [Sorangium sp. So ce385]|uniref:protein kinase domain-containing protein n=1 Tax=Sorangium sp. So ce385 TaxID=3133308 RepID=UPI003F5C5B1D